MVVLYLVAVFVGAVATLLIQILWLRSKLRQHPLPPKPKISQFDSFQLPLELAKLANSDVRMKKESCLFANLIAQFLFRELKDTKKVRKWFLKKLNFEFDELLHTTSGKLLDQITIRDLNLGTMFPVIHSATVKHVLTSEDDQSIEELDICLDVDYKGGFRIAVDVDLVFGRSAYVSVKVVRLKGLLRLQLTRLPFTHWSISFYDEPSIDFVAESRFEGHAIAQLTSLIINQIRRSIRKKHTLPNYKMRFKPFFSSPEPPLASRELLFHGHLIGQGHFDVVLIKCDRLFKVPPDSLLYCTLSVDPISWVEQSGVWAHYISIDIAITVIPGQTIGLIFKEEFLLSRREAVVTIESVASDSAATNSGIRKNDIIIAINGLHVSSAKHTTKLLQATPERLIIKVERNKRRKTQKDYRLEEDIVSMKSMKEAKKADVADEFVNISILTSSDTDDGKFTASSTANSTPELKHRALSSSLIVSRNSEPALSRTTSASLLAKGRLQPEKTVSNKREELEKAQCETVADEDKDEAENESSSDDEEFIDDIRKTAFVSACRVI